MFTGGYFIPSPKFNHYSQDWEGMVLVCYFPRYIFLYFSDLQLSGECVAYFN